MSVILKSVRIFIAGACASALLTSTAQALTHQTTVVQGVSLMSCSPQACLRMETEKMIGGYNSRNYILGATKITITSLKEQRDITFISDDVFYDGSLGYVYIRNPKNSPHREAVYSIHSGRIAYF